MSILELSHSRLRFPAVLRTRWRLHNVPGGIVIELMAALAQMCEVNLSLARQADQSAAEMLTLMQRSQELQINR